MMDSTKPLLVAALALLAAPAAAYDLADGKLDIGVSGEAAYGRTNGNVYGAGSEEGRYDNTGLGVSFIGHVNDRLTIGARFDFEGGEGSEVGIDWALLASTGVLQADETERHPRPTGN